MKALVISAGLMGGSIAKALAQSGWEVHATARKTLQHDGITFYTDFSQIPLIHFDVICICSPRGRHYEIYDAMFKQANRLSHSHLIDISSVQNRNNLYQLKYPTFVPCHPIAGSERTGFENSSAEILQGKKCLVVHKNPPQTVLDFWQACGMIVDNSITSCMEHDRIYAKVSHLPQLISFALPPEEKPEYREFYRLKHSSRDLWEEIFLHNRDWIIEAITIFQRYLKYNGVDLFDKNSQTWENIISGIFLKITTTSEQKFAGSGFKTITVTNYLSSGSNLYNSGSPTANDNTFDTFLNTVKQNQNAILQVQDILQKTTQYLISL